MRLVDADELKPNAEWSDFYEAFRAYSITQVDDAPTVEAIPVEWLKQWEDKHKEDPCYCNIVSEEILKDWRKENEAV